MKTERFDKLLSKTFAISRKDAQAVIKQGRAQANGETLHKPESKVADDAELTLDGRSASYEKYIYIMMHKPAGYLSATEDTRDPTVMELLPEELLRRDLGIVGRLDKDTTGLLLLTDNGVLNHRLTSPKYHMDKVYEAALDIPAAPEDAEIFASGIVFSDFTALPGKLEIDPRDGRRCTVTIREGKFHQVKRMFAHCGKNVMTLHRVSIGDLVLDGALEPGEWRFLEKEERDFLLHACGCAE